MALAPLAATPASAQEDPSVHMVTYIEVAPAAQGQAATLLRQLANASRKDAGLIRFEILQRTAPAREFVILESWKDQQAFDAHVATAHHKQFREKVTPHLIAPFDDRFSLPTLIGPSQPVRGGVVYVVTHVDVPGAVRDKGLAALTALSATEPQGRRQFAFRRGAPEEPHQSFHGGRGLEGSALERRARACRRIRARSATR